MEVKTYSKKPIPVKAIQFDGHNIDQIIDFGKGDIVYCKKWNPSKIGVGFPAMLIRVYERGPINFAHIGDYIIKGQYGELFACCETEFNEIYEEYKETK